MADVNLPSINELSQMASMGPAQYQQAQRQINLATQFQNQNLQSGEYGLQKSLMDNNYQAANDPIKLQRNQQDLGIQTSENILKGVSARQAQALEPQELEAKRAKAVKEMSEAQLADMNARAEKDMMDMSLPEERRALAKEAWSRSAKQLTETAKYKNDIDKTRMIVEGRKDVAETRSGDSRYSADQRRLASEAKLNGVGQDAVTIYQKAKGDVNQATAARGNAINTEDPEQKQYWLAMAKFHEDKQREMATIAAQQRQAGNVDLSQLKGGKIPTIAAPVSTLTAPPMPGSLQGASAGPQKPFTGPAQTEPLPGQAVALELGNRGERIPGLLQAAQRMPDGPDKEAFTAQLAQSIERFRAQAPAPQAQPQQAQAPQAAPQIPASAQRPGGRVGVIGPDGKAVTVPAAQLQQALQAGYKLQ